MKYAIKKYYNILPICNFSQEKKYFEFKDNSSEIFSKEDGSGKIAKELLYKKDISEKSIYFFIKDLLFVHNISTMEIENISKSAFKTIELYSPDKTMDYVKKVQIEYPIWSTPPKDYPKIYVVVIDDNCQNKYKAYEVNWQYYIE